MVDRSDDWKVDHWVEMMADSRAANSVEMMADSMDEKRAAQKAAYSDET